MANKRIGQAGLALIKQYEGCRLAAYRCAAGVWTIGYGHTAGVHSGMTITQAQADAYLQQDVAKFEKYVNNPAYVPIMEQLNQNQFDALVSFAFNLGAGNLRKLCKGRTAAQKAAFPRLLADALRRTKATAPQSALSAEERYTNLADAFAAAPAFLPRLAGARVLLLDDVYTTG